MVLYSSFGCRSTYNKSVGLFRTAEERIDSVWHDAEEIDLLVMSTAQAAVLFVYVTWAITAWFVFVYGALRHPAN